MTTTMITIMMITKIVMIIMMMMIVIKGIHNKLDQSADCCRWCKGGMQIWFSRRNWWQRRHYEP